MQNNEQETLLRVEHLCQYFKLGNMTNKAVDDVSFDIKKGEVFGLVGESGCGKTTTGRSIIKIYDCTSGSVYFENDRVCAGTLSYKNNIKNKKQELNSKIEEIKKLKEEELSNAAEDRKTEISVKYDNQIFELKDAASKYIHEQKQEIKSAKYDHKHCDKNYIKENVSKLEQELNDKLLKASSDEEKVKIEEEYKPLIRHAKNQKLVTKIQMIFQDPIASLDPRMTVREIISEGLVIQGIKDKKLIDKKVYEMLELVGLVKEHAGRYPHEFSGGQRQRIGIARAIIMNPELIIADEPISALDVSIQAQVINLLNDLRKTLGLTIMFIAHDLSVVKYFSDRIGVMYYGRMVELASSDDLFAHPLHPYTRSLLSAIPLPDPEYEKKRKRIIYNPLAEHDYSKEQPTFREVSPKHFVLCNTLEFEKIQKELKEEKNKDK